MREAVADDWAVLRSKRSLLHQFIEKDLEEEVVQDILFMFPLVQEQIQHCIYDTTTLLSEEDTI